MPDPQHSPDGEREAGKEGARRREDPVRPHSARRLRHSELPPWHAVAFSRHRLGCWVPLSRWRVQNPAGPGRPPDSRPRQPRPALPLPGAEHSCTSSLGPAAHSVPGRAQAELREMSLRTDFPESAKQIAAGNHQQKNTSNGRGAEAAAPAGRAHWTRHVGSYKKRWRRNVCEQHLETSQRAGSFVCTERNHHRQVWGRERICGVSIKIGAQRKSCQALPCLAAPENPPPCTQRCPRSRQHPGTAWPRLPRPLRVT